MTQPSKPARMISVQAMLFTVFGVGLLMAVCALWFHFAARASAGDQARLASDALMHVQRIGKAAPAGFRGDPEAFAQLEQSRAQLSGDLRLMKDGASAGVRAKLASTDQAAATILKMQPELVGLDKALGRLDALAPELLAMSEELLSQTIVSGGTPRELALISRMGMLIQRMALSAHEFADSGGIRPESALQLGRDITTFRATVDGFLDGSEALQVKAEGNPAVRELLAEIMTRFGTWQQLVSPVLANLPKYAAAKNAELSIFYENEELAMQLAAVLSGLHQRQGASEQARLASDALIHAQRIARAAPNAIQGHPEAFAQLEQSREIVNRSLSLLAKGGDGTSRALGQTRRRWVDSDNAAGTILKMKPELTAYGKTCRQLTTLSPELLSLTEELLHRRMQKGAAPRELAAIGRMATLTQRLALNASTLLTADNISPEGAFQLGRDASIFRATVDGLLNGHAVMQLSAIDDPETRALIGEIGSKFTTYNQLVSATLDKLAKFSAAKGAELAIHHESEEVRKLLVKMQTSLQD